MVLQNLFDLFLPIIKMKNGYYYNEDDIFEILDEIKIHNILRINCKITKGISLVIIKKKKKFNNSCNEKKI